MNRASIDKAVLAQLDRRDALLRDIIRSGGTDCWSHLHSHGHHFATIISAGKAGYLKAENYRYTITDAGRSSLLPQQDETQPARNPCRFDTTQEKT